MTAVDVALFLATSGHSGVDTVMKNLAVEMAGRGVRVDLLRIDGHGPDWEGTAAAEHIVGLGVSHVDTSLLPLVRYLRRVQPAVLLTDKDRVNRVAVLARALARSDTRLVVRVGTTFSKNLQRRGRLHRLLQYLSARFLYPRADAIIVPSEGAAEDLAATAAIPRDRIRAVPSPVITPRLLALADRPVSHPWLVTKELPVFLGVGELCARKDFASLVRAFARVRSERPSRLIILGEGRKRGELEALVAELGIGDAVDLPGFVENPYAFMRRADVFVLSSRVEGSPVVLMEALGLGLRCVATDCPSGPREVLEEGRYGALVPVGDVDAMAGQMAAALGAPAPEQVAWRFAVEPATDAYLEVLGLAGRRHG